MAYNSEIVGREGFPLGAGPSAYQAAGVAQLVEHNVANVVVVGSIPITRSRLDLNNLGFCVKNPFETKVFATRICTIWSPPPDYCLPAEWAELVAGFDFFQRLPYLVRPENHDLG